MKDLNTILLVYYYKLKNYHTGKKYPKSKNYLKNVQYFLPYFILNMNIFKFILKLNIYFIQSVFSISLLMLENFLRFISMMLNFHCNYVLIYQFIFDIVRLLFFFINNVLHY